MLSPAQSAQALSPNLPNDRRSDRLRCLLERFGDPVGTENVRTARMWRGPEGAVAISWL
jgi:hypothetical protein